VIARCAEVVLQPPALAALDLALWDLAGRRVGMPAWRLLGEAVAAPEPVRVNWTLTAADRSGAVEEAARARTAGFDTLKAKVAIGDDHGRLAAIRAFAGTDMLIRIDANGAWTPVQARAALRALEPIGLELCEEPARRARAAGYEVFLASTLDGPLGIAAALHAAAVLRPGRASGLATLGMFAGRNDPLPPTAGRIAVPSGRGLGDGLLDWYRD
jgi:L-alanine-DL-glutamate epimerase-like enolase superfamily enzyme